MAMGAETGDVFRMVVGNGLKLALTGVALEIEQLRWFSRASFPALRT